MKFLKPIIKNWSYLADLIVVIIGILIAFTLNNWRKTTQDKKLEQHYLEQLHVDFRQNFEIMSEQSETHSKRAENLQKVLLIIPNESNYINDSVQKWIIEGLSTTGYKLIDGTYKSLVQSGDLNRISNKTLRFALASFGGLAESEFNKLHMQFQRTIDLQLSDYYMNVLGTHLNRYKHLNGYNIEVEGYNNQVNREYHEFKLVEFSKDNYFVSFIDQAIIARVESNRYLERLNAHIVNILHLLELELGIESNY